SFRPMRFPAVSLRWLLVVVTLLASLMFAVSVGSLSLLLRLSTEHRMDRGRDVVQRAVTEIAASSDPTPGGVPRLVVIGLHGGVATDGGKIETGISPEVDRAVSTLVAVAPSDRAEIATVDVQGGTIFLGARRRAPASGIAWVAYMVSTPKFI